MKPRVLFVDDEEDIEPLVLQKFRRQIRAGEVSFTFARDGIEALECLGQKQGFDLVVTDINMPRMDGLTLLERLQAGEQKTSTIIVSAYGDMANIRTAMNRGAFDFLTKPIDFADLETTIAKTLRHVAVLEEARHRQVVAERAFAALSRYFSPNLAERLATGDAAVELTGQRRDVSAIFTDIAGFTSLAESLNPSELSELLNEYIIGTTGIVFAHEGTVAKTVGDAIHVLFGAPGQQEDHAERAVACVLAIDDFAERFRKAWAERGVAVGMTRIGAHSGPAIVGNFGGEQFFDYTAYGDTINTAARLEAANKYLGTRACVSAHLAARVNGFFGRPVGKLMLRGRSEALEAFEPLDSKSVDQTCTRDYLAAYADLDGREVRALPAFAALVGSKPDDTLASFHLKRLLNGETGNLIPIG